MGGGGKEIFSTISHFRSYFGISVKWDLVGPGTQSGGLTLKVSETIGNNGGLTLKVSETNGNSWV